MQNFRPEQIIVGVWSVKHSALGVAACTGASRANCLSKQGSGRYHHGYGYDPSSDGWKVDCSSGTQKSFSTYTVAKPEVRLTFKAVKTASAANASVNL